MSAGSKKDDFFLVWADCSSKERIFSGFTQMSFGFNGFLPIFAIHRLMDESIAGDLVP
jgi:hypothetical protein